MCSSWVSFSTSISCLKCESWSPIPYKAPFSWDLNRILRFIFSAKFMFCLFPCFHSKPRDIWLFKKCLSRRECRLSAMCVCQRGIAFPSYFACLMVKDRFFFKLWGRCIVVGKGHTEFYSSVDTETLGTLYQVAESYTYWGRWEEQRWKKWEGRKWTVLPPNVSQPLSWMYSICSSASPLCPSPVCFLPQGPPS